MSHSKLSQETKENDQECQICKINDVYHYCKSCELDMHERFFPMFEEDSRYLRRCSFCKSWAGLSMCRLCTNVVLSETLFDWSLVICKHCKDNHYDEEKHDNDERLHKPRSRAAYAKGRCLNKKYPEDGIFHFECLNGDRFSCKASSYRRTFWCKFCKGKSINARVCRDRAKKIGHEFLDDEFVGKTHDHNWRCDKGHIYKKRFIKVKDGCCPVCK